MWASGCFHLIVTACWGMASIYNNRQILLWVLMQLWTMSFSFDLELPWRYFFFALQPPIYGAYLYDAVYQYAIALNKTLAEKEPLTVKNISNKLHDIQYDSKLLSWVLFLHRYHLSRWEMRCLVHCTVGWLSPGSRLGWVNVLCFWAKYSTLFIRSIDE